MGRLKVLWGGKGYAAWTWLQLRECIMVEIHKKMIASWPKYFWNFSKHFCGSLGVQNPHHGGAIVRFELLDDDATKIVLDRFTLHKGGTRGATWGHLLQRRVPANRDGAFSH